MCGAECCTYAVIRGVVLSHCGPAEDLFFHGGGEGGVQSLRFLALYEDNGGVFALSMSERGSAAGALASWMPGRGPGYGAMGFPRMESVL